MSEDQECLSGRAQTPTQVLLALAARCERDEISRELDIHIQCYLREGRLMPESRMGSFREGYEPMESVWPKFTGSIDAAVTLVPAGSWRETNGPRRSINIPSPVPNFWRCEVTEWTLRRDFIGWAATESMAICAAALKARAALAEQIQAPDTRPEGTSNSLTGKGRGKEGR